MKLNLREDFASWWQGKDPFAQVRQLQGEIFRELEARRTLRFEHNGKGFFAKLHFGVGWRDIVDNLIRFRWPVLGATNEWQAIKRLQQLGVKTMTPVAFGIKGCNPATQQSFIITEELHDMISLEDLSLNWQQSPPPLKLKRNLIAQVAKITRTIHENGLNHRDYYICHFLLSPKLPADLNPDLWLIDLHRAQVRNHTPHRWLNKDLAALYFSVMDIGLCRNDLFRFIKIYTGKPLKQALKEKASTWRMLAKKAEKLYARKQRKGDAI
ncbi:lipopolysaccharide core heptose(I) kinase RfaP [Spartinivicinus poritis]|uniref:Lipopolysaccharide core heptose(I) kinase n=1 Tax=Spartinivicinus poritis TaxID=2994640 RepID=A0ABT5U6E4_9GAMM|nr:lipopolysaccharide core heptose(I) kinase RfaP [Spartinivicinus sp. A2-2]MDE1461936.1 lipopolysaccharide core heptose(I) kinase RfaP [Spartinivicinus sp. A2-2]